MNLNRIALSLISLLLLFANFCSINIDITTSYVGRYATSMEMSGLSITILKLDEEFSILTDIRKGAPFNYTLITPHDISLLAPPSAPKG